MRRLILLITTSMFFIPFVLNAQDNSDDKEKIKTGWTFGAVPAIAYDSDIGFKYGGLINFYDYGNGEKYPKYKHSIYLEWSRTTKGSGINQFTYDSESLIPGVRVSAEASLLTEQALDFYGFNGYNSIYNLNYEDDEDPMYISRMYYRIDRKLTRIKSDFQGKVIENKLRWLGGIAFYNNKIGTVDIDKLNKGKTDNLLPDTISLYDQYVEWGVIPENQANGGRTTLLKVGSIYDTRDNEANPMKGIWTELQFLFAPSFLGNKDYAYSRLALTHRQYFTVYPKVLNFVYRISYQGKLTGKMPFYMLPFVYNTAPSLTRDGLGGAKTLRGILRNRIVGEDFVYGNIELRWKFLRTNIFNQNLYFAINTFLDGGMVTGKFDIEIPVNQPQSFAENNNESLHLGYGAGLHIALNENFIVAIDYGMAVKKQDGDKGLYIGLNYLF